MEVADPPRMRSATTMCSCTTLAILTLTLPSPARAQTDSEILALDKQRVAKHAQAELSLTTFDLEGQSGQLLRLDLLGEWTLAPRWSLYGQSFLVQSMTEQADHMSVGNIELGGAWRAITSAHGVVVAHGGVVLPTASGEARDGFDGSLATALSSIARPSDQLLSVPDVPWVRLGTSAERRAGRWRLRADAGVDVPLSRDDESQPIFRIRPRVVGRANVGAGVNVGPLQWTAALLTLIAEDGIPTRASADAEEVDEVFTHHLALAVSADVAGVSPTVGVIAPLDTAARGKLWAVSIGAAATF